MSTRAARGQPDRAAQRPDRCPSEMVAVPTEVPVVPVVAMIRAAPHHAGSAAVQVAAVSLRLILMRGERVRGHGTKQRRRGYDSRHEHHLQHSHPVLSV